MFKKIFKTNGPNQALAKTMTLMTSDVVGSVKLTCQSFFCADQTFDAGTHVLVGLWKISVSQKSVAFQKLGIEAVQYFTPCTILLSSVSCINFISIFLLLCMNFVTGMTI